MYQGTGGWGHVTTMRLCFNNRKRVNVIRTASKWAQPYLGIFSLSRNDDKAEPCYRRTMFVGFMTNMAVLTQGALWGLSAAVNGTKK
jgi:hypothetical protein